MKKPVTTADKQKRYPIRTGEWVTSKDGTWPTQYTNRTQAERAAAQIPGAEVIQRGRPFYVRLTTADDAKRRETTAFAEALKACTGAVAVTVTDGPVSVTTADNGINEAAVLDAIVSELDGQEWNADTCDRIAALLRTAGYPIRDFDGGDDDAVICDECGAAVPVDAESAVHAAHAPSCSLNPDNVTGAK